MRKLLTVTAFIALTSSIVIINSPTALTDNLFTSPSSINQTRALTLDKQRGILTMAPLLEQVTPAVVSIRTEGKTIQSSSEADEFFERFFGQSRPENRQRGGSIGSGVIIDASNGYILTNNHVVDEAEEIRVTLKDKRELSATLIGGDERTDIAVLQIQSNDLREMRLAPEDSTSVGDYVIAIGNAFGLEHTVTSGIVSATGRFVPGGDRLQDMIQTDASINPGNSGGALINSKGELIGINTMIISRSGGNNGIGFAVPVKMAKAVMNQLISYGEVRRGRIGVTIRDIDPALQEAMNLSTLNGALVNDVNADSPADNAGLKSGDIIVKFNGEDIANSNDIRNAVGLLEPGTRVDMAYLRDGRRRYTKITVGTAKDETTEPLLIEENNEDMPEDFSGAKLTNIPADMELRGGNEGVLVASIIRGSKAARAGLRQGDIIRKVGTSTIKNLSDFQAAIDGKDGPFALSVERDGSNLFLAVR